MNTDLKRILHEIRIGELPLYPGVELGPQQTVADAAAEMQKHSHGSAVICEDGRLIGIFTERDLLRFLADGKDLGTKIADAMTAQPKTISVTDRLIDAIRLMDSGHYRRIPVVDENGASAGICDVKTLVRLLVEHFPEAVYTQASKERIITKDREGA